VKITVGMAACGDWHGAVYSIQALNFYHPIVRESGEIIVVDNAPELIPHIKNDRPCPWGEGTQALEAHCVGVPNSRYVVYSQRKGTAAPRQKIFEEAKGDIVLVIDSHVLVAPGAIDRLVAFFEERPECNDLVQGPWLYDSLNDGVSVSQMEPQWRSEMFGTWFSDPRANNVDGEPFEIPMQGLGLFACRRSAWLGFNPAFKGFGGEEGYIHEKFRLAGRKTFCAPWLRWWHCFKRINGVPYRLAGEDKLWNYLVGAHELKLPDDHPMSADAAIRHFCDEVGSVPRNVAERLRVAAASVASAPPESQKTTPETIAGDRRTIIVSSPITGKTPETLPEVACLMMTHGRAKTALESIRCFENQDYPNRKLVILNTGEHPLGVSHPLISEIHDPGMRGKHGLPMLGELENRLLEAAGDSPIVKFWEDDDLYLPWHLSQSVAHLLAVGAAAWKPQTHWYEQRRFVFGLAENVYEGSVVFRRDAIPALDDSTSLTELCLQLANNGQISIRDLGPWTGCIYRFGISPDHLSGVKTPDTTESWQERLAAYRSKNDDHGPHMPLSPNWVPDAFHRVKWAADPWIRDAIKARFAGVAERLVNVPADLQSFIETKFPNRTGLVAMDVGRKKTAELCQCSSVRSVYSVHPDVSTMNAAKDGAGPMSVKIRWLGEIPECISCAVSEPVDIVFIDAEGPLETLRQFLRVMKIMSNIAVVVVDHPDDTLLLRCVLEPTHQIEQIGSRLAFSPRHLPPWMLFRP
jgi:glycosyltransferase involved in cell wall biosynthesis